MEKKTSLPSIFFSVFSWLKKKKNEAEITLHQIPKSDTPQPLPQHLFGLVKHVCNKKCCTGFFSVNRTWLTGQTCTGTVTDTKVGLDAHLWISIPQMPAPSPQKKHNNQQSLFISWSCMKITQETIPDHHTSISTGKRPLCNLWFADDINLMGRSNGELQDLTNRLVDRATTWNGSQHRKEQDHEQNQCRY